MVQAKFKIKISRGGEAVMSPRDLLRLYLYGITTKAADGTLITYDTYNDYILFAQREIEGHLNVKLRRQAVRESVDYLREDVARWNIVRTSYPVETPISMVGEYGSQKHVDVPRQWMSAKLSSDNSHNRAIHLIPAGAGSLGTYPVIYSATSPFLATGMADIIPNYWKVTYITGFKDKIPYEIYDLVGKLAAVNVFNVLGDIILGAGIASQSIGIDGLSQSISTTSSATNAGYGARVIQYLDELKKKLPQLRDIYTGIRFTCV